MMSAPVTLLFPLLAVLAQAPAQTLAPPPGPTPPPAVTTPAQPTPTPAPQPAATLKLHGALEGEALALPSGPAGGATDGFVALRGVFGIRSDDVFELILGPTFRLRLLDLDPQQRASDLGGLLRKEDWDSPSDFGQVVQLLHLGAETSPVYARIGPVRKKTLGLGHLVSRYNNQLNPDYHPAAGTLVASLGPTRTELFVSDVLGLRLFSGELAWDLGATFSSPTSDYADRFKLALTLAHDEGKAGLPGLPQTCPPEGCLALEASRGATLLHFDGRAMLLRTDGYRIMVFAGMGSRGNATGDLGFVLGGTADVAVQDIGFAVKLELRKQAGGFRYGFFGPQWELSRFSDTGFTRTPQAAVSLPDGISGYGELRLKVGENFTLDGAAEVFVWGRLDTDVALNFVTQDGQLSASVRFSGAGLTTPAPRYATTVEGRWRVIPALYVLGSGGTVFFPQPDSSLSRGIVVSVGAGVDFER